MFLCPGCAKLWQGVVYLLSKLTIHFCCVVGGWQGVVYLLSKLTIHFCRVVGGMAGSSISTI